MDDLETATKSLQCLNTSMTPKVSHLLFTTTMIIICEVLLLLDSSGQMG